MRATARVIDGTGRAWNAAGHRGRLVYYLGDLHPGPARTVDEIHRDWPPVRPVGPPTTASIGRFCAAVRRTIALKPLRRRLVATVCAALHDAAAQTGPGYPLVRPGPRTSAEDAVAAMATTVGAALADQHDRVDPLGRDALTDVILDWITHPGQYTEPAAALAPLLANPVALAGGWTQVTDEQLRTCPQAALISWYVASRIEVPPCGG